jgi:hypothetical protein
MNPAVGLMLVLLVEMLSADRSSPATMSNLVCQAHDQEFALVTRSFAP